MKLLCRACKLRAAHSRSLGWYYCARSVVQQPAKQTAHTRDAAGPRCLELRTQALQAAMAVDASEY
jgi:hypothetical protein